LTSSPESAILEKMPYPGGKNGAGVYQRIINLMPPHAVYVEPFLGSGAVMRLKRPASLNIGLDLDGGILSSVSAWSADIGGNGEGSTHARNSDDYRRIPPFSALLQAFTTETGEEGPSARNGDTAGEIAGNDDVRSRWVFRRSCGLAFLAQLASLDPARAAETLVYCDPPYLMSTRSAARKIYEHEFSDVHHRQFLRCVRSLRARVMVSGYWSELYARELQGWDSIQFQSMTRGGRPATEWLWFNYARPVELHDYQHLGKDFRERERIKRKKLRWSRRLERMPELEKQALYAALQSVTTRERIAPAVSQ
jgi:DNA adenine methylase